MDYINKDIFKMMYELVDIEDIVKNGFENVIDITVTGNKTFLLDNGIISHNSAVNGILEPLGRKGNGYYALKGKPLNAYSASTQKFTSNKELTELYSIITNAGGVTNPKEDGQYYELTINGKTIIANINDEVLIEKQWIPVKHLI